MKKLLLEAMSETEKLWELLGNSEVFESMSVNELEELLKNVEALEKNVTPYRSVDPEFDQIYFDCLLMKSFIVGEQNYIATGRFG